jgi:hypothetical protein
MPASTFATTPKSIYTGVNRIQWEDQTLTFETFLSQTNNGKWDHNPPHQREVVHPSSWGSRIIDSAIWFGELPQLYFHPRHTPTGTIYESLDGKQRASQVISFMNDGFALKVMRPEFEHINGKKFSELDILNQNEIRDLKLRIRLANRTLTREEIYQLFSRLQDNKRTTTGEQLNAMPGELDELVRKTNEAATDLFDTLIPSDKRKRRHEVVCRCLKSWCYVNDDTKALTDKPKLGEWYQTATVPEDAEQFTSTLNVTLQVLQKSNLLHKQATSAIIPIFRIVSKFAREHPSKLRSLCGIIAQLNPHYFQSVAGDHSAILTRYHALLQTTAHLLTDA